MQNLQQIIDGQKHAQVAIDHEAEQDQQMFVWSKIEDYEFILPIEDIQEVSELSHVKAYPESISGHLGVANLRGQIIPLFCMLALLMQKKSLYLFDKNGHENRSSHFKMVVFSNEQHELFAIVVEHVKKINLKSGSRPMHGVYSVKDRPVKLLSKDIILSRIKMIESEQETFIQKGA